MLRPGINPLDRRMGPGMKTMEVRDQHYSFPSAEELSKKVLAQEHKYYPTIINSLLND